MFNLGIFDFICIALIPIIAFLLAYWNRDKQPFSWRGYYLANAKLSSADIGWTYLGANLAFSTIFIVLSEESYHRGWIVLVVPIAWILGTCFLLWVYPKINNYAKQDLTLHQSIGKAFNSKSIQKWASLWTIISFVGTVGMEFFGGIKVLSATGMNGFTPVSFAIILAILVIVFTTLGGMRGIAKTASFLDVITALSAVIILVILGIWYFGTKSTEVLSNTAMPPMATPDDNINFAVGMFLIFFPFQLFILDTWQRAAAWKDKTENKRPIIPLISSSLVIVLVCIASIGTGIYLRANNITVENGSLVLFEFLKAARLDFAPFYLNYFITGLVLAGFIAAIISTADELLNCCSLSYIADTLGITVKDEDLNDKQKSLLASSGRLWTVLFGFGAVVISLLCLKWEYQITSISVAVFSTQIVFLIPLYYTLKTSAVSKAPNNTKPVIIATITSFAVSLTLVFYGIGVGDRQFVDLAPLAAIGFALIIFFIAKIINKLKK